MLLFSTAVAIAPNRLVERFDIATGEMNQLVVSEEGHVFGRSQADGSVFVLDTEAWKADSHNPCTVTSVAPVPVDEQAYSHVYVGCADGTVKRLRYENERLVDDMDDSGALPSWDVATTATGAIDGLWWDGTAGVPYLYSFEAGTPAYVHVLDPENNALDGAVTHVNPGIFPYPSLHSGYVDAASDLDFGQVYISHGGARMSTVSLDGFPVTSTLGTGSFYSMDAVALGGPNSTLLWGVDQSTDTLLQMEPTTGTFSNFIPTISNPKAVAASHTTDDEWLMVAGDGVRIYSMTGGFITDPSAPLLDLPDADIHIQDAVVVGDYAIGGGEAGKLRVYSAVPWVSEASVTPITATSGTTLTVSFALDVDADWEIRLNGSSDELGHSLLTGTSSADEMVQETIEVDDTWEEGVNQVYVFGVDGTLRGHRRVAVTVDDVPGAPTVNENVGISDNQLTLTFDGIEDADLASYQVYISETPFESADYTTGGPQGMVGLEDDGPTSPLTVTAEPGARVTEKITGLENDVTYYLAVRAFDAGGLESVMSNVVSGTPEKTLTASDLAGETGGTNCSTGGAAGGMMALFAGMFALFGRRRTAALGLLAIAGVAQADEVADKGDITKQYGNFEFRYGGIFALKDEAIGEVFKNRGHNMLQVEIGPQITRFFEIDAEFGFYQELAFTLTEAGVPSDRRTMLTQFPMGLGVNVRGHIIDEQILVPYAKFGLDYVYYTELTDDGSDGKSKLQGGKMGFHFAGGVGLLLDTFSPRRASLLEAQTGINDTYLTLELRRQVIDGRKFPWGPGVSDGFEFTGTMFTAGIKLDY